MADASIALNRFGLGARPDEPAPADPRNWLHGQLTAFEPNPVSIVALPGRRQIAGELAEYLDQVRALRQQEGRGRPTQANPRPAQHAQPAAMQGQMADTAPDMAQNYQMSGTPMTSGGKQPAAPADANDPVAQARRFAQRQARDYYVGAVGGRTIAALTSPAPFAERLVHFWANHFAISIDKVQVVGLGGLLEFEAIRPHVLGK
ncbi:MAG: DUF1800 family protein, partial [Sphingomonas sp.]